MQAQSERALALAQWLEAQPQVERVYYPGLRVAPAARAGDGAAVGAGRRGGVVRRARRDAERARDAFHVIDSTRVLLITANLGDTKTTITHPATHLARPPDRGAAPGRRHRAGHDPPGGRAGGCRGHQGRPAARPDALMSMTQVRTRIAPSPTGFLHLGTARTALYSVGLRAPLRRRVHPAHRGHRRRALDAGRGRRRSSTACTGWGWTTTRARSTRCSAWTATSEVVEQMIADGHRLPLLLRAGRTRRDARGAARARREAALRRHLAARARQDAAAGARGVPPVVRFRNPQRRRASAGTTWSRAASRSATTSSTT